MKLKVIKHREDDYTIEVSDKKCSDIAIGSVISLYYVKNFSSYYVPYRNDELVLLIFFSLLFLFPFYKFVFNFFIKMFEKLSRF
ncbi:hypothetical protein TPENAI_40049 [Tenacibaculum litopenaei]